MSNLDFGLWPKQLAALMAPAQEKLYGGSAGPGKSYLARVMAIVFCTAIPGFQMFLFRRTRPDLYLSHYVGKSNFFELLADPIREGIVEVANLEIRFKHPNGLISRIHGCHCQHEQDVYNYKSVEMHGRILEETTEFSPFQIQYLGTRARMPEEMIATAPEWMRPMLPLALYPTNFDDQGGSKEYLCEIFKVYENWKRPNKYEPSAIWTAYDGDDNEGKTRIYIPAILTDNPNIDKKKYIASLRQLRHPDMVRSLIEGDPTVIMGSLLPELSNERHVIPHFDPPKHWTRKPAHDWGSAAPAATVWAAISDGEGPLPRGAVYFYKERLLALPHDKTKGLGWSNAQIAEDMYKLEDVHRVAYLTDTLPFQNRGGVPMYEEYSKAGIQLIQADMSDKAVSVQALRSLLVGDGVTPMAYFSEECPNLVRTLQALQPHPRKPEKPADHAEDHLPDCAFHIARDWKYITDAPMSTAAKVKKQIEEAVNTKTTLRGVIGDYTT